MVTEIETPKKKTAFTATDADGKKYTWSFWRAGGLWFLRDHTSYVRTLESTWRDSVPHIRLVLENHGMTAEVN